MTAVFETGTVPPIEIRHRLRIAREFAGLDQGELAERMGISRTSVGNSETGATKPRRITLNAWALACGVPVSWIIYGDVPYGPNNDGVCASVCDDAESKTAGRRGISELRIKRAKNWGSSCGNIRRYPRAS